MQIYAAVFEQRKKLWSKNVTICKTDEHIGMKRCNLCSGLLFQMLGGENHDSIIAGFVPNVSVMLHFSRNQVSVPSLH